MELQAKYNEVCNKLADKFVIEIDIFGKLQQLELDNNSISHGYLKNVSKFAQDFIFLCTTGGGK